MVYNKGHLSWQLLLVRQAKLLQVLKSRRLLRAMFMHRVLAGTEHRHVLRSDLSTVVDIGANRGQFALSVRNWSPRARIISFEPLHGPASVFRQVFLNDDLVTLHEVALGPQEKKAIMHVSGKDDSSSLLPITSRQTETYPGTDEVGTVNVRVTPLDSVMSDSDIVAPALLKLDVQGFEMEALRGCESLLPSFDWIYCECSFVELYSGQKLAADVIEWLSEKGFHVSGVYNTSYDANGLAIQSDILFQHNSKN